MTPEKIDEAAKALANWFGYWARNGKAMRTAAQIAVIYEREYPGWAKSNSPNLHNFIRRYFAAEQDLEVRRGLELYRDVAGTDAQFNLFENASKMPAPCEAEAKLRVLRMLQVDWKYARWVI